MDYCIAADGSSVTLRGQFVFADHPAFRELLEQVEGRSRLPIMLQLDGLDFIDSAGMGMLLILRDQAAKKNLRVTLKGAHGQVKKMFDISRFETHFSLEP